MTTQTDKELQNCPRCGGRPLFIEYPLGVACMCPVKDKKLPIYVSDSNAVEMGFASYKEAWNALHSTDDPNSLSFLPLDGWRQISTAPDGQRVMLGPREAPVIGIVRHHTDPDTGKRVTHADVVVGNRILVRNYQSSEWRALPPGEN